MAYHNWRQCVCTSKLFVVMTLMTSPTTQWHQQGEGSHHQEASQGHVQMHREGGGCTSKQVLSPSSHPLTLRHLFQKLGILLVRGNAAMLPYIFCNICICIHTMFHFRNDSQSHSSSCRRCGIIEIGPGGLRAPCVLACAMRSLAIVITIVQSFSLSFSLSLSLFFFPSVFCFWPTSGNLPCAK